MERNLINPMIIDAHVHIIRKELINRSISIDIEEQQIEKTIFQHKESPEALEKAQINNLLLSMQDAQIDKSIIMGLPWVKSDNCKKDNDFVINNIEKYPEKFIGFGVIQPKDTKTAIKEILRCKDNGLKGIKIIPNWQGFYLDDLKIMTPIIETISDSNMILLPHIEHPYRYSKGDMPYNLFNLFANFPNTKIIAAHLGGMLFMYLLYSNTKPLIDNIYFDTSVSASMKMVKVASDIISEDKLIFGTDYPFNSNHSQKIMLNEIKSLDINKTKLEKCLSNNILNLLGEK